MRNIRKEMAETAIMKKKWLHLTIFTGKVLNSYILDGNLLQEIRVLAARVPSHDAFPSQPIAEPGQVAVTVEGIGQKVPGK